MELDLYLEPLADGGTRPVFLDGKGQPFRLKPSGEGPGDGCKRLGTVNTQAAEFLATRATILDTLRPILQTGDRPVIAVQQSRGGGGVLFLRGEEADLLRGCLEDLGVPPNRRAQAALASLLKALSDLGTGRTRRS